MYVVKEIAPNGKTAELHLDTSIINAIHIMMNCHASQIRGLFSVEKSFSSLMI